MQFRFRCAAVLTAVLLCSAAALPALAEETATPETADSVSTYTGWKTVNGKDYWYENGVKQGTTGRGRDLRPRFRRLVLAGRRPGRRKSRQQECLPGIQRRQMGAL